MKAAAQTPIEPRDLYLLMGAVALAAGPQLLRVAPWAALAFAVAWVWRLAALRLSWPLPDRRRLHLVALKYAIASILFVTALSTPGGLGRDAGVNLLVGLIGLKLIELKTRREYYLVAYLLFFLLVTGFFYTQTPLAALHMLVTVSLVLAGLVGLEDQASVLGFTTRLRVAAVVMLQAVPVLFIAYVLFPRLAGPLWALPSDALTGQSGLSDSMTPGSISELSLSDALAFRVSFEGPAPPPVERYWRGPVLWVTNGRSWGPSARLERLPFRPVEAGSERYAYTVTLEAQRDNYVFFLDLPTVVPPEAALTHDYVARWKKVATGRLHYRAESATRYRSGELQPAERETALALPPAAHPQTRALAAAWQAEGLQGMELANRALSHFREQDFYYTLRPPIPEGDPIDEFLFEARRGFCEHYAAAFVVLMRTAGLPARVVTGYQGGTWNPIGEYWMLLQRDAHAWAEVWLPERGWTRVDPTAAVAPERIERGVDQVLPALAGTFAGLPGMDAVWFRIDALQNAWNQWVLGYDQARQRRLLEHLGLPDSDVQSLSMQLVFWLTTALLALGALWWWLAERPRRPRALAERLLLQIERRYARRGLPRRPAEAPLSFIERVAEARPHDAAALRTFARLYARSRYEERPDQERGLRAAVNELR